MRINGRRQQIPRSLEDLCDPARLAVIVYDMQLGVVGQVDDGAAVRAATRTILDAARQTGYQVFFTRPKIYTHSSRRSSRVPRNSISFRNLRLGPTT